MTVIFVATRLDRSAPPPELAARVNKMISIGHSPAFLFFTNVGLALGFWSIFVTRAKKKYYWLRVVFYGMLLGAVLGEILSFLPPANRP